MKRLGAYLAAVVLVAAVMRFMGYAAAISYAAIFKIEDVDAHKIGEQAQNVTGALGLIVVFALLALGY